MDWGLLAGYITPQGEGVSEACLNASQIYLDALNNVSFQIIHGEPTKVYNSSP